MSFKKMKWLALAMIPEGRDWRSKHNAGETVITPP